MSALGVDVGHSLLQRNRTLVSVSDSEEEEDYPTVLIVDDEPINVLAMQGILKSRGLQSDDVNGG